MCVCCGTQNKRCVGWCLSCVFVCVFVDVSPYSSVVEHPLSKRKVRSSILRGGKTSFAFFYRLHSSSIRTLLFVTRTIHLWHFESMRRLSHEYSTRTATFHQIGRHPQSNHEYFYVIYTHVIKTIAVDSSLQLARTTHISIS